MKHIQASSRAFAAIRSDGSVVTWGNPRYGGDSSKQQDQLILFGLDFRRSRLKRLENKVGRFGGYLIKIPWNYFVRLMKFVVTFLGRASQLCFFDAFQLPFPLYIYSIQSLANFFFFPWKVAMILT